MLPCTTQCAKLMLALLLPPSASLARKVPGVGVSARSTLGCVRSRPVASEVRKGGSFASDCRDCGREPSSDSVSFFPGSKTGLIVKYPLSVALTCHFDVWLPHPVEEGAR